MLIYEIKKKSVFKSLGVIRTHETKYVRSNLSTIERFTSSAGQNRPVLMSVLIVDLTNVGVGGFKLKF